MTIKDFIKKHFSFGISLIYRFRNREKRTSYGNDNPDKTFYIYGVPDSYGGLWWHINKVLMHLGYVEDKGYIPVIDMQNYRNQYIEKEDLGSINVWEVFFNQPAGYSLSDIASSKNIVIGKKAHTPSQKYLMGNSPFYDNEQRIQYFHHLFNKYISFNTTTRAYLDNLYDNLFKDKGKIVGVLCRGTDYVITKPKNHPIQPDPEDVINDVKFVMKEYGCEYVFIATEDSDILNKFIKEFGERTLFVEQMRVSKQEINENQYLASIATEKTKGMDTFSKGIGYLASTYLLSKCNCFLAGRTGGSKGVLIMAEGFEYKKIYDLGTY